MPPGGTKPADVVIERSKNNVLKVDFVDVQQGDGAVLETPKGQVMLIDGGDNQMFARYLASRFRGTSDDRPKEIDCILVTHGDADHFEGLDKDPRVRDPHDASSSSCSSTRSASTTTGWSSGRRARTARR